MFEVPPSRGPGGDGSRDWGSGTFRGTTMLAVVMVGWLFFLMALAAFGGEAVGSLDPVSLGRGVVVNPAPGWSSADDTWQAGPEQTAFKRAGAVAVFVQDAFSGDARDLLDDQVAQLEREFNSLRVLPATSLTIDGGLPALGALFDGTTGSAELEGEIVAATRGGTGVLMVAFAPIGQLRRVQDDLNTMLDDLVVP